MSHKSAKPSHYNQSAGSYDAFNEKMSEATNRVLEKLLKKYKAQTVLDLTCGTGSQVFWLAKRGFEVTGSDINAKMLQIARAKAAKEKLNVKLLKGDMRTIKVGAFDAVITIFNAIGHLTKTDFEKAMENIHANLKKGGLYIFDINNLSYLKNEDQITKLTIDWQKKVEDTVLREVQYSTIDENGILASYTTAIEQNGAGRPKVVKSAQTLQVYTAKELKKMLERNHFKVLAQYGIDGKKFVENKSDRILTVAKMQ